jgi:glycerophosphoryl diester phosphodiesterase
MAKQTLGFEHLISHRFRGFAPHENTLAGLESALDLGVLHLEFDVRIARCGTPMIYHDEYALDGQNNRQLLCDYKRDSYANLGGVFAHMPTLDALLSCVSAHKNQAATLLIDIKDLGFEEQIHALVMAHRLQDRVTYVSWLPDVLYRLAKLAPDIPKCFSHWAMPAGADIIKHHEIHVSQDGYVSKLNDTYIVGQRSGWVIIDSLKGDMLDVLKSSKGGVCIPKHMARRELSDHYHEHGLFVSTYAYVDTASVLADQKALDIDLLFVDDRVVFDELV